MTHAGPFTPAELRELATEMLTKAGVTAEDAAIVADEVVDAEQRGYASQGLVRLPPYVRWALSGEIRSPAAPEVLAERPAALTIDGRDGWGHVVALSAMRMCAERARESGTCVAAVRNVPHIGRLGYYVEAAAEAGVIGIISGSGGPDSATMAPWGGREPRLSTNPIAFGFPNPGGAPIVTDVSTTQAARGKILIAAASGEPIPPEWAFDAEGSPTTDPNRALPPAGTLAPLGGHKGYALAIVVELLCGGLAGPYPPATSSMFVAAIDPAAVTTPDEYAAAVAELERSVTSSAARPGFDEVLLPGAGSARRKQRSETEGVTVVEPVWAEICGLADELGVAPPSAAPA